MGKQESPKNKESLWMVVSCDEAYERGPGSTGTLVSLFLRLSRPVFMLSVICVLHSQSPSGSHMGDHSGYLQIDPVTCIILQAFPPELPAPVFNNPAIHVAEPLAHFFTMCLVVCVSGPCVTQWNGRWDRCQEPGVFALSQTRDLGKVIWLSSVSPPPLSFMWNTP